MSTGSVEDEQAPESTVAEMTMEPEDLAAGGEEAIVGGGSGDGAVAVEAHPRAKRFAGFRRLYRGETTFDFIGRQRIWYLVSAAIIIAGLVALGTKGLNLSIDFKGGTSWTVPSSSLTVNQATAAVRKAGLANPIVEQLGKTIEVSTNLTGESATAARATKLAVESALASAAHVNPQKIGIEDVGPTWGGEVSHRALIALVVFFAAVVLYISVRFEWKMAIAALIAVMHDLLVTVGVYAIFGFQVSPDTVVAILTILGYSLYDTVVVFDRVGENSKGFGASGRMTYSEMVNLSMNQTLARSMNTSLVAILPVLSVLIIGAQLLGATTLQNYGLALVIGLTSGAYSSIFIASPLLSVMKEREPRYVSIRQKLESRGERAGLLTPAAAAALGASAAGRPGGGKPKGPAAGTLKPGGAGGSRPAGAVTPGQGQASSSAPSGGTATATGGPRPSGNRPAPRPRKGGGGKKGGKRRR